MKVAQRRATCESRACGYGLSRAPAMTNPDRLLADEAVEAAIARVLDAEHDAHDAVRAAERTAAAMAEAARAAARALAERTERRIRGVRAAFEARTAAEVAALDAAAAEAGARHDLTPDELARLDVAVATLAARLTGARVAMSAVAGSLEYAHARLSARYGNRPDELAWRRIEHVRALPALLDAVRASALSVWLGGIGAHSTPHEIERVLRGHWRDLVAEVTAWMPEAWQPAVRWCALLVDLPLLQHLARGGAVPPWLRDDPIHGRLAEREPAGSGAVPADKALAPLAAAWIEPDRIGSLWLAEWRRRIPASHRADDAIMDETGRALGAHFAAFRDRTVRDGWPLRRALQARLSLLFRRAVIDPSAAFIFLALSALDLERLRGEILRRVLFPGMPLAP